MAMKKNILAVLILPLLLPSLSSATSVRYSTVGTITGTGFITYKQVTNKFVHSMPAVMEPFGTLKIHCEHSSCLTTGATVAVTISQSIPGSGIGTTSPVFTGTFTKSVGGAWTIVWSGAVTITAGGFATTYTPITSSITCGKRNWTVPRSAKRVSEDEQGDDEDDLESRGGPCSVKLLVDITQNKDSVPEPSTGFLLELGTLGLIGFVTASRKKVHL